jgi:uncharacterized membrane protein YqjE
VPAAFSHDDGGASVTATSNDRTSLTGGGATAVGATAAGNSRGAHAAAEPSLGALVKDASESVSTIVRGEIELAKLELRSSVKNAGTGIGFFGAAVVLLLFSLVYGFQSLAEGIAALGVYRWLAFLIVFALQLVVAALFAWFGIKKVKRVRAPERTMRTTKETVDYLKNARG